MKTQTKAQIISRTVRTVLTHNGDMKQLHLEALRSLVGNEVASKLLDMKISSQLKKRTLALHERRALIGATIHPVKKVNGKISVQIFGCYTPLFNY